MKVEDVRAELRAQAREAQCWELPATDRVPRRAPLRRWAAAFGPVLAVAALVAGALLVVPSWWTGAGPVDAPRDQPVTVPGDAPTFAAREWRGTGPRCAAPGAGCQAPETVEVDGRTLQRTDLRLADRSGVQRADRARAGARLDLPGETSWLMVGLETPTSDIEAVGIEVLGGAYEVETDGPQLFAVGGGPRVAVPVFGTVRGPDVAGAQVFVATYARARVEPTD